MPTYDYKCPKCDLVIQIIHKMSETYSPRCVTCEDEEMKKVISGGAGVHFKGSGFYETDYKKK
jgi:putative FmdB family regulatory protein